MGGQYFIIVSINRVYLTRVKSKKNCKTLGLLAVKIKKERNILEDERNRIALLQ
jgi:hypothetical protein